MGESVITRTGTQLQVCRQQWDTVEGGQIYEMRERIPVVDATGLGSARQILTGRTGVLVLVLAKWSKQHHLLVMKVSSVPILQPFT